LTNLTVDYANATGSQTVSALTYGNLKTSNTSGTQTLAGTTTVNGTLSVAAGGTLALGTYNLGSPTATTIYIGSAAATISGSSGTFTLGGTLTITDDGGNGSGATISAKVALGATRTVAVDNDASAASDLTISGVISGASYGITKTGAGYLALSANNTMTGTTTISAGTIDFAGTAGGTAGAIDNNAALIFSESSTYTFSTVISGTGTITSTAADVILSGNNTYSGTTTISSGKVNISNANALGATSAGTTINSTGTLVVYGSYTYAAEPLTINSTGTLRTSNNGSADVSSYTGAITLGTSTPDFYCYDANDVMTLSGVISGAYTARFGNSAPSTGGIVRLSAVNTYSGNTELYNGTLQLGAAGVIADGSNFVAAGGTFSTGATAGYSETMGTLKLTENTTFALGTGSHSIHFAASNAAGWTAAKLLRVTGWQGSFNCTTGTSGQIFTGASAELLAGQLTEIFFSHPISGMPYTACQLGTGEVVPTSTLLVDLVSLTGELKNKVVTLHWTTASEVNASYYEILRSSDAVHFESIGKVDAAGNSNHFLNYQFSDENPLQGYSYYKLIQYDFDGASESFHLVPIVNSESDFKMNSIYPNPCSNFVNISFQSPAADNLRLTIVDGQGKEIYIAMILGIEGENKFTLPTNSYSEGKYVLQISNSKKESIVSQIVVQH
jgi:autotransporter-associated beta strand protein